MEREKLEQAKKTFAEDSDKYHKYKKDLRDTTKDVQQEHEKAVVEKNSKIGEIKRLEADIISKDMEIKRIEDNLTLCKQRKAFLDELAISAGKKTAVKPKQVAKKAESLVIAPKGRQTVTLKKDNGGGFFMTSVNTKGAQRDDDLEE